MKNRKLKSIALIALLTVGTLAQTACGNATTLAKVGAGFKQAAAGFKAEVGSLKASGLLTDAKFAELDKRANGLITAADALNAYLNSLPGVTAGNRGEVLGKIAEATGLVRGLIQNPDLLALPANNLAVKILLFADITLQNFAIVLAGLNPPAAGVSAVGVGDGAIPLSTIKAKVPPVPKGAEKYFSQ